MKKKQNIFTLIIDYSQVSIILISSIDVFFQFTSKILNSKQLNSLLIELHKGTYKHTTIYNVKQLD